jgi:hypothetical protein
MSEFFNLLFDWRELVALGVDVTIYFIMALVGTGLFVLRLAIALFGGGDSDFDMHADDHAGDSSFTFFSLLSILAFFMGAGWMGLTCRVNWDMSSMTSALAAAGFGTALMAMASGLMAFARSLNQVVEYDLATAVGHTASVYMSIPARGEGRGKIKVAVSGRLKMMDAISTGPSIPEFRSVKVIAVRDDGAFEVEPEF